MKNVRGMFVPPLGGDYQGSDRAETFAAHQALQWHRILMPGEGIKIKTDNTSVRDGIQNLKAFCNKGGRPPTFKANQDLWSEIEFNIKIIGPEKVHADWVKGHATEEHISQGKALKEEKREK